MKLHIAFVCIIQASIAYAANCNCASAGSVRDPIVVTETSAQYVETGDNCNQTCNWYYTTSIDRNLRVLFVNANSANENNISMFRFYERGLDDEWYPYHTFSRYQRGIVSRQTNANQLRIEYHALVNTSSSVLPAQLKLQIESVTKPSCTLNKTLTKDDTWTYLASSYQLNDVCTSTIIVPENVTSAAHIFSVSADETYCSIYGMLDGTESWSVTVDGNTQNPSLSNACKKHFCYPLGKTATYTIEYKRQNASIGQSSRLIASVQTRTNACNAATTPRGSVSFATSILTAISSLAIALLLKL